MGFLDNSGDIILDAVLTDTGRMRLARGDGSFRIAKFALGDDEINYGNYNANDPSGSAYYDLDILKTPVFEAFTNNTSNMQSKLLSISRNDILYLPVIKLNAQTVNSSATYAGGTPSVSDVFLITVDDTTSLAINNATEANFGAKDGILYGNNTENSNIIRLDQGLDNSSTEGPSPSVPIDADLNETQYIIEVDNRFGELLSSADLAASVSFVDDDSIASYYLSLTINDESFIKQMAPNGTNNEVNPSNSNLGGPRGTRLTLKMKSSINLSSTISMFATLGSTMQLPTGVAGANETYLTIDSTLRVTGATTGYRIDVPIRYIKKQ
jgi:hypothetical protein